MASLAPCTFTRYKLDDREKLAGQCLTSNQRQVFQNERANIADQLLALKYDPLNPHEFGLQQAALTGQLDAFTWLIEAADAAEAELNNPDFNSEP